MYNGVGVKTARGTGTNGYVQKNFAALPSSKQKTHYEKQQELAAKVKPLSQLGPDKDILEHDRKRQIEARLIAWADENDLLDSGKPQAEIDEIMNAQREKIAAEFERQQRYQKDRELKKHESTHRILEAKARQHAQLGQALGVANDYKEGQAFDRELQEARRQQRLEERLEQEKLRRADEKDRAKRLHEREEERHRDQQARIRAKLAEVGGGSDRLQSRRKDSSDSEDNTLRREKRKRGSSRSRSRSPPRGRRSRSRSRSRSGSPVARPAPPVQIKQEQRDTEPSPHRQSNRLDYTRASAQQRPTTGTPPGPARQDTPSPPRGRKASRSPSKSSSRSPSRSRSRSRSRSGSSSSSSESRGRKRVKRE